MSIYYLIGGCILSFLVGATAHARVSAFKKKLIDLDWDTVAGLATDVATIKKRLQKMQAVENGQNHGRLNEMQILQQLAINKQKQNGAINDLTTSDKGRGG